MSIRIIGALVAVLLSAGVGFAAHPLVTDDTGTQGTGKFQVEMLYEHDHMEGRIGIKRSNSLDFIITGGVAENLDLAFDVPVLYGTAQSGGIKKSMSGFGDLSVEAKWRFFETDGLSLALKPGISIPSGDYEKGLGSGRVGGRMFLLATKDLDPFSIHANVGYTRNENKLDENKDLWHASIAAEYRTSEWMKIVGDVGTDASTDKQTDTPEAFVLGGLIFSATPNLDLDIGVKGIFTDVANGFALLAGATFRF